MLLKNSNFKNQVKWRKTNCGLQWHFLSFSFSQQPGERVAMESKTASSADELQAAGSAAADTGGKHRILAELKRVEQESSFLEEEMEELQRTDTVSTLSKELMLSLETRPDPLLPLTNGPINPSWDRWFEGPQDLPGCQCQIL